MNIPGYIASFDSAATFARATACFLEGRDFPGLGIVPRPFNHWAIPFLRALTAMPRPIREAIYAWSGWNESIPARKLSEVRAEDISKWATSLYPERRYQAVMVGSSGGASTHLCAALGIPWLPQTMLVSVRRNGVHPDEPGDDLEWGKRHYRQILDHNPELQLHQMHDPNQDRLMVDTMGYFRIKRRTLGEEYKQFLRRRLEPGGTIILNECNLSWPTTRVDERFFFQVGGLGGATPREYYEGSRRVENYLERYDSHRRRWPSPEPDARRPEGEWGFEPSLRDDVVEFARNNGYRVRRIVVDDPQNLSPLVADLYRWWYRRRGMPAHRLVGSNFLLVDPYWAIRTGSVPFWTTFNKTPSAEIFEQYLDATEDYDEIGMTLFNHGVDSIGLIPIERARRIVDRARRRGFFIGLDEEAYPFDFSVFAKYQTEYSRKIPARYGMPGPMHLSQFDEFLDRYGHRYPLVRHPDHFDESPGDQPWEQPAAASPMNL